MAVRKNSAKWYEKHNRWQIKVQKDGDRQPFYSSIPGPQGRAEANKKADAWLKQNISNDKKRIEELYLGWIERLQKTTGEDHWKQYRGYLYKWILPTIGNIRISKLNEQHLQDVLDNVYADQKAKKTILKIRSCMTAFVKFCRKIKATDLFPEDLTIPKNAPIKEKVILQPHDLKILFECDKTLLNRKEVKEFYINAYRFEVLTGLRPGEVFGLQNTDIKDNVLSLKRSINKHNKITSGKNENAKRNFILTDFAQEVLKEQKELLKEYNVTSKYIFSDTYGDPIRQANYYKRWIKYRNYNNLTDGVTPYSLRHTFVSIVKTLPQGLLKPIIGHSKNMDTYGTYSHEVAGDMQLTAQQIQNIFSNYVVKK